MEHYVYFPPVKTRSGTVALTQPLSRGCLNRGVLHIMARHAQPGNEIRHFQEFPSKLFAHVTPVSGAFWPSFLSQAPSFFPPPPPTPRLAPPYAALVALVGVRSKGVLGGKGAPKDPRPWP